MSRQFTATLVPPYGATLGNDCVYEVFYAGTTTTVAVYSDAACTQQIALPGPVVANIITFYVANGSVEYDIMLGGGNTVRNPRLNNIWALPGPIWELSSIYWSNDPAIWNAINPQPVAVKTAQNVGQFYTANDIIRASMRLIQVSAVDTDLTANELADGLESLNRMLDSWSADELKIGRAHV